MEGGGKKKEIILGGLNSARKGVCVSRRTINPWLVQVWPRVINKISIFTCSTYIYLSYTLSYQYRYRYVFSDELLWVWDWRGGADNGENREGEVLHNFRSQYRRPVENSARVAYCSTRPTTWAANTQSGCCGPLYRWVMLLRGKQKKQGTRGTRPLESLVCREFQKFGTDKKSHIHKFFLFRKIYMPWYFSEILIESCRRDVTILIVMVKNNSHQTTAQQIWSFWYSCLAEI